MTRLSVNINKVALVRNSRGEGRPDLYRFAQDCEEFGAQGITVHPRPDQRHIRYDDIPILKEVVTTEFNIEGYPSPDFIDMVCKHKPDQVTLVPDPPGVLTSSEGWDAINKRDELRPICQRFKDAGIRVSIFLDPDVDQVEAAKETGTDRIELYTGPFAKDFKADPEQSIEKYAAAAKMASKVGLGLNAGHDLDLTNLNFFKNNMVALKEVSIGHALISDALYYGIHNTIQMYLQELTRD